MSRFDLVNFTQNLLQILDYNPLIARKLLLTFAHRFDVFLNTRLAFVTFHARSEESQRKFFGNGRAFDLCFFSTLDFLLLFCEKILKVISLFRIIF